MIKVSEVVQQLVEQSPFMTEALQEGLLNVSAVARKLQPDVEQVLGKPIKQGAIVMAINRLQLGEIMFVDKGIRQFFRKLSDISVRSNLLDYTFRNSDTILNKQARLLNTISEQYPNLFYSFSQGISETTIIVTDTIAEELEALFAEEHLLDKEHDLSSITLMLPTENRSLYGIYYYILKELAWYGINLVELISTSNEFSLIVKNSDLDQAFSVINGLRSR